MQRRQLPWRSPAYRERLRRIDRLAADLNVLLVLFAIGLATLDLTFLFSQRLLDRLPEITRVTYTDTQPTSMAAAAARIDLP
jgi:hypothetical protein